MKSINNITQLSRIIKGIKNELVIDTTNFFLMPDSINKYISENRMFWVKNSNGLFLICEEKDFYYLYFFLSTQVKGEKYDQFIIFHKPIIIDLVFNKTNKPISVKVAENYWINEGFKIYRINLRMTISESLIRQMNKTKKNFYTPKYYINFAKSEDTEEILNLWKENLDRYTSPLPDFDRLNKLIIEKSIIAGYNNNGIIVAALQMNNMKNVSYINFLAVNENYRRQGLAQALIDFYLTVTKNTSRYYLWVNEKNNSAIKLYECKGYVFDGKMNCQMAFFKTNN